MSISPNRLKELQNIPDTAIDTSDIPELDQQFWETAKMVKCVSPLAIAESVALTCIALPPSKLLKALERRHRRRKD